MDPTCLKHQAEAEHNMLLKHVRIMNCVRKPGHTMWDLAINFIKQGMTQAWHSYEEFHCTCEEPTSSIPSTFRMGASWASVSNGANDVANLSDLEDIAPEHPESFVPYPM